MNRAPFSFYEFFAGGGMARLGLDEPWACVFANDFDPVKAATYRANFADAADHFHEGDVWKLAPADLPGQADLAWASSPCQDFSLAGARAGLAGGRSSAFFGFWRLIEGLAAEAPAPRIIVVENVGGLLTPHGRRRFAGPGRAVAAPLAGPGLGAIRGRGGRAVGAVYRRMRVEAGRRVQGAEARFDGLAGCLRTPRGGSSRQVIVVVEAGRVRTRLLTSREAARL